jgi:type I restriction enzyme S subunit
MTNLSGTNLNNGAALGPQGEGMDSPSNFSTYPAYKDSGVEWLGLVPEHWVVTRLGRVTEIESGYPFPAEQFVDDGIPVVRMSDLKEGQVSLDSIKRVEARFVPVKAMAKADDLLIGLSGSISNFAQVSASDLPLAVNQRVGIIRADDSIEATIAKYFVISKSFICQIESAVPETTILNISMEQVRSCALAWPPRFEQTQIARFLDHETARIDALIAEQQRLIELLKEKRQAVISHAVTKGLDPTVPMKDSGVEWLGEVPAHWSVKNMKHISSLKGRLGWQGLKAEEYRDEGPFVVSSAHFNNFSIDWDSCPHVSGERYNLDSNIQLCEGDVLLMKDGAALGKLAYIDHMPDRACLNSHLLLFRPVLVNQCITYIPKFLFFFMRTEYFQKHITLYSTGTTFAGISQEKIGSYRMALPPLKEQNAIVKFLEVEIAKFDTLIVEAQRTTELLQERRSALISAAVTGKIDVRGWQPPASSQAPEPAVAEAV